MSFCSLLKPYEKNESNSYCSGGHSGTIEVEGDISKTGRKLFISKCLQFWETKSLNLKENAIKVECLNSIFYHLGNAAELTNQSVTKIRRFPGKHVKEEKEFDRASLSGNFKASLSTILDEKSFHLQENDFIFEKLIERGNKFIVFGLYEENSLLQRTSLYTFRTNFGELSDN